MPKTAKKHKTFTILAGLTLFFCLCSLFFAPSAAQASSYDFIRGDSNGDGYVDISDPIHTLLYIFSNGSPPSKNLDSADANDDGKIALSDAIYLLTYLFKSGPVPSAPFATAGLDPTPDNIDNVPPQGTIVINNNNPYTNTAEVTLALTATDLEHSVTQMQFSNDNTAWSTPEDFAATKTWGLTPGEGERTVYAKLKDAKGNWSEVVSDTIIVDTIVPRLKVISPQENDVINP